MSDWKSALAALLERNKQYPSDAVIRREQGVAQVVFSQGRLLERCIEHSSGAEALDQEALALVKRAAAFPTAAGGVVRRPYRFEGADQIQSGRSRGVTTASIGQPNHAEGTCGARYRTMTVKRIAPSCG